MKNTIAVSAALSLLVPLAASAAAPSLPLSPMRSHVRGVVRVPLKLDRGMPIVELRLGHSGPYRFAIDTSVKCSLIVDKSIARNLNLPHRGVEDILNPATRKMAPYEIVSVDHVRLGDATFDGVNATVDDILGPFQVDGLIGFGLLSDVLATLDYSTAELRISSGALPATIASVRPLTLTDGVPAIVVQAGDRYMFANINTEVPAALTVPANLATASSTADLRVGAVALANARVATVGAFPLPTLGNAFLKNAIVTFDAAHGRVAIEQAASDRI